MAKKKSKKKAVKRAPKRKRALKKSDLPVVATLAKRPLGQLVTLGERVSKAMAIRVKKNKKLKASESRAGILAGLFSGPKRPDSAERRLRAEVSQLREMIPELG